MKQLMGTGTQIWFGTDGKLYLSVTAPDWASARKELDRYFAGTEMIGQQAGFQEARKHLPEKATFLGLFNMPGCFEKVIWPFLGPYVKKQAGGNAALPEPRAPAEQPGFAGGGLSLQPELASFDLWIPAKGVQETWTMLQPLIQAMKKQ